MTTRATIAHKLHSEIKANVDAYYANAKDHATFGRDNRAIWDRATTYGVDRAVLALMRGDMADFETLTGGVL